MEFKEKLQLLRTQMKLSQEDLADLLLISRQSVTKWENGQTFPDIQNLIQLSEIFKVSIDRLVKEKDNCNITLLQQKPYSNQKLRLFLIQAKKSTYITSNNKISSQKPNSIDYRYTEGDYLYLDTYVGSQNFAGEESVYIKEQPVWAMNYYGKIRKDTFPVEFLKEALSYISEDLPCRGPECYQQGEYSYHCQTQGEFDFFHGQEQIYCRQEKIYQCIFHGGIIL